MNDRAERMHTHIDHIEARIDLIRAILAGNRISNHWPMPRDEYLAVAERLDQMAALCRQHVEAYDRLDQYRAEADERLGITRDAA